MYESVVIGQRFRAVLLLPLYSFRQTMAPNDILLN